MVNIEIDDNDNCLVLPLDEDDNIGHHRNVQQFHQNNHNVEQNVQEPFRANVNLVMSNIDIVRSHTADVLHRRPFNPNSQIISLNTLVKNRSRHRTNIFVIILSIASASVNTSLQVQQRYNGTRGQVSNVLHDRKMVVMCHFSPPGSNTATILFGSGCFEGFFEAVISLRDNGSICK